MLSLFTATPAATPPTFPADFYSGEQQDLSINQGGYDIPNGACCSQTDSPQCKIQAISMGADVREQGSMNRSRSDSAQGSILTWFAPVNKQMALLPGSQANSSHKWVCAQYCPQDGDFTSSVMIGDGHKGIFDTPKDLGKASVTQPAIAGGTTKTCEHWRWTETLLKLIPLQKTDFFVDMAATPPVPFFSASVIEPLGKKIGQENSSFIGFAPLDDVSYFDIDPDSLKTCPMSQNCNQNNKRQPGDRFGLPLFKTMHDAAKEKAAAKPAQVKADLVEAPPPPQPNVSFGTDFVANEDNLMLINQGGKQAASGDVCCDGSVAQCQVQLSHIGGTRYFDLTNKRERFEDTVAKQVTIDLHSVKKSILVNVTNGLETCQEYCPIDPDDTMSPFNPFDPFDAVKDMGKTTLGGKTVEHYRWSDVILKIIKMQTTDFYAQFSGKTAIPVAAYTVITPFGMQQIGSQNQTWTNWTAGTPSKAKFDIAGVDSCPLSNNCGSPQMQAHRLRTRQLHSFYRHMLA